MGAKYCIHTRCNGMKGGEPCAVADDCPMFKWDIERQKGEKKEEGKDDGKQRLDGK